MKSMMDADILIRYMRENSEYLKPLGVKHMGGEPTLHPRFFEILKESVKHFRRANVFTNGSKMIELFSDQKIKDYHDQGRVEFTINGFTFNVKEFQDYKKFVHLITLHCVVPLEGVDEFIQMVIRYAGFRDKVQILLSPDTQVNLFDDELMERYRKVWIKAVTMIQPLLEQIDLPSELLDHSLPKCFFTEEMLKRLPSWKETIIPSFTTCCSKRSLGLIHTNFDIYQCNQTNIKVGSMLDEKGNPKSYPEILKMVRKGPAIKICNIKKLSDTCKACPDLKTCRAGCYYNHLLKEN
jgi:radical SAM protein with 4Fe4S-binding SPASM domain